MLKSKYRDSLLIKKITLGDLSHIYEIEQRCYPNPWNFQNLKNELSHTFAFNFKLQISHQIAGYCFCSFYLDNLHINNFCIDTIFQNQGYGFRFLKLLINEATSKGVKLVTLEVNTKNTQALSIYKKTGFQNDRLISNFYSNGDDAQRMLLYTGNKSC